MNNWRSIVDVLIIWNIANKYHKINILIGSNIQLSSKFLVS